MLCKGERDELKIINRAERKTETEWLNSEEMIKWKVERAGVQVQD